MDRELIVLAIMSAETKRKKKMRTSNDDLRGGRLINGYDYDNQAWVVDGKYVNCGHAYDCGCFAREHSGEMTE